MILLWIAGALVLLAGFMVAFGAPYVPSKRSELRRVFSELYKVKSSDHLVDIGSGDGIVLREFMRRGGRRATGYEINPVLVLVSRYLSRRNPAITTQLANLWRVSFPDKTTVVYVFGDARDIRRMQRKIETEATRLGRTLHVISYGFQLPDYKPVRTHGAHFLYAVAPLQAAKA